MFEDALLESSPRRASVLSRIHALFSAFAGTLFFESILIGMLVLVPLIYTQALPKQLLIDEIHISPPPGPPPVHPTGQRARPAPHAAVDGFTAPPIIPVGIVPIAEPPEPLQAQAGPGGPIIPGAPDGFGGNYGFVPGGDPGHNELPPPPPVVQATPHPSLLRLSSGVVAAKAVYQPKPVYPPLAMTARIQGTVVLQAIIGKDGVVQDLKVVSGHPLLVRAAMEAVKTWQYQPTLLNNEPVDVLTEVDVQFNLSE
jgi:protein TonB